MTVRRLQRMRTTLERRQPDLRVILDQVHKSHNIAAVLRTCDAVGVHQVHAVWPDGPLRTGARAAAGASRWVQVRRHGQVSEAIADLRGQGYRTYAAHFSPRAVDFRKVDYTRPCALLLGAELEGVSEAAADLVDEHVVIPMQGLGASLNVSVAAAVILFEAQRQREAAGLYQQPRLDAALRERLLFEWLHPKMARRCRQRGEAYPRIDEEGDLVPEDVSRTFSA